MPPRDTSKITNNHDQYGYSINYSAARESADRTICGREEEKRKEK